MYSSLVVIFFPQSHQCLIICIHYCAKTFVVYHLELGLLLMNIYYEIIHTLLFVVNLLPVIYNVSLCPPLLSSS